MTTMRSDRRGFNTVLLYAGVLALGWLVFDDYHKRQIAENGALTQVMPSQVQRLSIERPARPLLQFQRAQSHWTMLSPVAAPADDDTLEGVLRLLRERPEQCVPQAEVDLAQVGLSAPAVRVYFELVQIDIGARLPLGEGFYVRANQQVCRVGPQYIEPLLQDSGGFVDLALLPSKASLVQVRVDGQARPEARLDWQHGKAQAVQRAGSTQGGVAVELDLESGVRSYTFVARGGDYALILADADYELLIDRAQAASLGLL